MSRGLRSQVERLHGAWHFNPLALPSWIWSVQHQIRALCPTQHVKFSSPLPKCKCPALWSQRFPALFLKDAESQRDRAKPPSVDLCREGNQESQELE